MLFSSETPDRDKCCGCSVCAATCPVGAIDMFPDTEGFYYPKIDYSLCIECEQCEQVCPIINISSLRNNAFEKKAFGGYLADNQELQKSSSGGAFYKIASKVLRDNGYVCGVIYSDSFRSAYHICSNQIDLVKRMRGSKYIQSYKNPQLYLDIKNILDLGNTVMFTGTPCEIVALRGYLSKEYSKLLTCDLICHGPTTANIQSKYVHLLEKKYSSNVVDFNVRYKKYGWNPAFLRVEFDNGEVFCKPFYSTPLGIAFQNIALRPYCYHCIFKGDNRSSDITMGDFWGISSKHEYYNDLGISAIIANTPKGEEVINGLDGYQLFETDLDHATNNNEKYYEPTVLRYDRDEFFNLLRLKGLTYAVRKTVRSTSLKEFISRHVPYSIIHRGKQLRSKLR